MVAFGDVRIQQTLDKSVSHDWDVFKYDKNALSATGSATWSTEDETLIVTGSGSVQIPHQNTFDTIRFDVKFSGDGNATIQIGELEVDLATEGDQKTGGITRHPIKTNLIDQHEWCVIEIQQSEGTSLRLNGITLFKNIDVPSMQGNAIQITVRDAKVSFRRTYIKKLIIRNRPTQKQRRANLLYPQENLHRYQRCTQCKFPKHRQPQANLQSQQYCHCQYLHHRVHLY